MAQTIRVGILGAGNMARTYLAGWAKTPATLVGIYALDTDRAIALAEKYNFKVYPDEESLLKDVDVIDICTPTYLHAEQVIRAAGMKKHVVCEKPLALDAATARTVVDTCAKAGVHLLVAHVVRFFPEYANAKAVVDRGDIGNVAVVRLTRCSWQPKLAADNWFLDPTKSGGMMLDLMIHDFDYARWIAGEVKSVYARSVRGTTPTAPTDYGIAILTHENGAISNIEGGWAYPAPMFRTSLEIAGDAGLIEHPADSSIPIGVYLKQSGAGDSSDVAIPGSPLAEDPYTTEIKHFYEVLIGKQATSRVLPTDGLAAVQIAQAAIRSAQTGRSVSLAEVSA